MNVGVTDENNSDYENTLVAYICAVTFKVINFYIFFIISASVKNKSHHKNLKKHMMDKIRSNCSLLASAVTFYHPEIPPSKNRNTCYFFFLKSHSLWIYIFVLFTRVEVVAHLSSIFVLHNGSTLFSLLYCFLLSFRWREKKYIKFYLPSHIASLIIMGNGLSLVARAFFFVKDMLMIMTAICNMCLSNEKYFS